MPFKNRIHEERNSLVINGEKLYMKGSAMHATPLNTLCDSVIKSWDKVKVETVITYFKKCGVSNGWYKG